MKRLSFAAFIATTVVLLNSGAGVEAHAASLPQIVANSARGVATSMSSVGYCYRGVKRALKKVGVVLTGGEAYMAKHQLRGDERFQEVSLSNLKKGDILVHGASGAHPHGHIAVYLGNGMEASDHVGRLITGRRYGGTTVFRMRPESDIADNDVTPTKAIAKQAAVDVAVTAAVPAEVAPVAAAPVEPVAAAPLEVASVTVDAAPAPAPAPKVDLSLELSSALMQVVQMAQSAQINLTQALSDAVGAISSGS